MADGIEEMIARRRRCTNDLWGSIETCAFEKEIAGVGVMWYNIITMKYAEERFVPVR